MDIGDQQERWTVAGRVENTRGYAEGEIFLLADPDDHLDATVVWESRRDTRATASMVAADIVKLPFHPAREHLVARRRMSILHIG